MDAVTTLTEALTRWQTFASALLVLIVFKLLTEIFRPIGKRVYNGDKVAEFTTDSAQDSSVKPFTNNKVVKCIYATQTDDSKKRALLLAKELEGHGLKVSVQRITDYDTEDFFTESCPVVLLLSTYTGGSSTDDADWLGQWLDDAMNDFRVGKLGLSQLRFAVLSLGDRAYGEVQFCSFGKKVDAGFASLGASRVSQLFCIDKQSDCTDSLRLWVDSLAQNIKSNTVYPSPPASPSASKQSLLDVEDMGSLLSKVTHHSGKDASKEKKEMITPTLAQSLTKQGYKLVGSHSGVKICRWTKSMLRGRGGCYKHTFYGIESHRCMETTPSLACANKCVFCWRHHTNPVGTEWRWKMDEPEVVLKGALEGHRSMINVLKGVPGLVKDRFDEAMEPKHCALSLVGKSAALFIAFANRLIWALQNVNDEDYFPFSPSLQQDITLVCSWGSYELLEWRAESLSLSF